MTDTLHNYADFPSLRENKFRDLLDERQAIDARIKKLNKQKKELSNDLQGLMATVEAGSVFCDGWKVTLIESIKRTLKKDKLLTLGVDPELIEQATAETPYAQLRVSAVKE